MDKNLLIMLKKSATDEQPASKWAIQKTVEANGDLIGKKVADRIQKVSNNSQQNNPETVTNEDDKEIPEERHISPEERQNITDD